MYFELIGAVQYLLQASNYRCGYVPVEAPRKEESFAIALSVLITLRDAIRTRARNLRHSSEQWLAVFWLYLEVKIWFMSLTHVVHFLDTRTQHAVFVNGITHRCIATITARVIKCLWIKCCSWITLAARPNHRGRISLRTSYEFLYRRPQQESGNMFPIYSLPKQLHRKLSIQALAKGDGQYVVNTRSWTNSCLRNVPTQDLTTFIGPSQTAKQTVQCKDM